jgi:hypothetical protein
VNAFRNRCKRGGDLTGRPVGPYVAVRPVGDDAASSVYYVLQCPLCGYETKRHRSQLHSTALVAKCGGCGRNAHLSAAAE